MATECAALFTSTVTTPSSLRLRLDAPAPLGVLEGHLLVTLQLVHHGARRDLGLWGPSGRGRRRAANALPPRLLVLRHRLERRRAHARERCLQVAAAAAAAARRRRRRRRLGCRRGGRGGGGGGGAREGRGVTAFQFQDTPAMWCALGVQGQVLEELLEAVAEVVLVLVELVRVALELARILFAL